MIYYNNICGVKQGGKIMNQPEYQALFEKYQDSSIVFGDDPGPSVVELFLKRRIRRIVLFTGRHSVDENGVFAKFAAFFGTLDIELQRFKEIPPEPTITAVRHMIDFLKQVRPDAVVALGGGSVMDAAKAAYLVYQAGGRLVDYFGSDTYSRRCPDCDLDRVICFPTTAGTGSEVTPYANIVDSDIGVKRLISDLILIPAYAFVIPKLTESMPPQTTLATGCDALAHLLEAFLNIRQDHRNENANEWALTGIRLVVENLEKAVKDPDSASRTAMSAAATLGGMAIRYKSTGLPHLCSFSWFGIIEHGLAVALLLPAAWLYYLENPAVAGRTMELRDLFPGETPDEVVDSYRHFLHRCGAPLSLKEYPALTPELLERTARSAEQNPMKLALAPREVPPENAYAVITQILAES